MGIPATAAWLAIVGTIVLGMAIPPVVSRLPSTKRWLRKLDERRLAELNVSARLLRRTTLWPQYLAPVPFVALAFASNSADGQALFLQLAGVVFFAGVALRVLFGEAERVTTLEREYRRFQQLRQEYQSGKSERTP